MERVFLVCLSLLSLLTPIAEVSGEVVVWFLLGQSCLSAAADVA